MPAAPQNLQAVSMVTLVTATHVPNFSVSSQKRHSTSAIQSLQVIRKLHASSAVQWARRCRVRATA